MTTEPPTRPPDRPEPEPRRWKVTRITEEIAYVDAYDEIDAEGIAQHEDLDWEHVGRDWKARCVDEIGILDLEAMERWPRWPREES